MFILCYNLLLSDSNNNGGADYAKLWLCVWGPVLYGIVLGATMYEKSALSSCVTTAAVAPEVNDWDFQCSRFKSVQFRVYSLISCDYFFIFLFFRLLRFTVDYFNCIELGQMNLRTSCGSILHSFLVFDIRVRRQLLEVRVVRKEAESIESQYVF